MIPHRACTRGYVASIDGSATSRPGQRDTAARKYPNLLITRWRRRSGRSRSRIDSRRRYLRSSTCHGRGTRSSQIKTWDSPHKDGKRGSKPPQRKQRRRRPRRSNCNTGGFGRAGFVRLKTPSLMRLIARCAGCLGMVHEAGGWLGR